MRGTAESSRDRGGPGLGGRASLEGGQQHGKEKAWSLSPGRACVMGVPLWQALSAGWVGQ